MAYWEAQSETQQFLTGTFEPCGTLPSSPSAPIPQQSARPVVKTEQYPSPSLATLATPVVGEIGRVVPLGHWCLSVSARSGFTMDAR